MKIDKLGWYRAKGNYSLRNEFFKVLHIGSTYLFCISQDEMFWRFELDGKNYCFNSHKDYKMEVQIELIEYIGLELPKEPRKFEFEGNVVSLINNEIYFTIHNKNFYIPQNGSRWKVTMEEVIE